MSDDLRELLHAAVPQPPAAPDRASGARERHRRARRRTALATTAAAVVVVVGLAVVPALLSGDDRSTEPAPAPGPVEGCPAPDSSADGADKLPDDPVSVRLCPGTTTAFDAPEDTLDGAAAQTVVALANTQPAATGDAGCVAGNTYLLVFTYADGHTQVVPVADGCGYLRIGDTLRENGDAAVAKYLEHLREQRAAGAPPAGLAVTPDCATDPSAVSPIARPAEMATAVLCRDGQSIPVSPADLAVLVDDAVPEGYGSPEQPDVTLVGTTAWGDTTMVTAGTDWWPGPQAQQVLERLVAQADAASATIDESSTPADAVRTYVGRLAVGDTAGAAALWMSLVEVPAAVPFDPAGAFEVTDVRPLRSISTWPDATAVTVRFETLAPPYGEDVGRHEVEFVLGRDENGAFRLVSMGR